MFQDSDNSKKKVLDEAIEICINRQILAEFLLLKKMEVKQILEEMYSKEEWVEIYINERIEEGIEEKAEKLAQKYEEALREQAQRLREQAQSHENKLKELARNYVASGQGTPEQAAKIFNLPLNEIS